jgi:hypothetical protein
MTETQQERVVDAIGQFLHQKQMQVASLQAGSRA